MKRFTKALMTIVAILLVLVLISSCLVSSTMAKYVITKSSTNTVSLTKFGLTLTVAPGETNGSGKLTSNAEETTVKGGTGGTGSLTYTLSNVEIKPGDDYARAVKVTLAGTQSVNAQLIVKMELSYTPSDFSIANKSVGNTSATTTTYFMPLGFTFGYNPATASDTYYIVKPWTVSTTESEVSPTAIANAFAKNIGDHTGITVPSGCTKSYDGNAVTFKFPKGKTVQFSKLPGSTSKKYFHVGFAYPAEYNKTYAYDGETETALDLNTIGTYLAEHAPSGATVDITYTFILEQY